VARFLRKNNIRLLGIRLDSGNLISDSRYARKILDKEGLVDTFIFASGNLDEYKICELVSRGAPIDAFGVGTHMGCSSDLPYTDVIYKLVEIKDKSRSFIPTMKLSEGKTTLPSRKQVFRVFDQKGTMSRDIIALDGEKVKGRKLLKKQMEKGSRLYKEKTLDEKRRIFLNKAKALPPELRKVNSSYDFSVEVSSKLYSVVKKVKKELIDRGCPKVVFIDIDTQHDFMDKKGSLYVPGAEKIIQNLGRLTAFASSNRIPIVSSQDTHQSRDPEFGEFPVHCVRGSKGCKKIKSTLLSKHTVLTFQKAYSPGELKQMVYAYPQIILEKNVFNVFSNPNMANLLESILPDKVYVYGVVTEYCVRAAVEELLQLDYQVVVVKDAVKELSVKEKAKLFSSWKKKGVEFVTTKQVLYSLQAKKEKGKNGRDG
jgi:nicotinamidase-related amidase